MAQPTLQAGVLQVDTCYTYNKSLIPADAPLLPGGANRLQNEQEMTFRLLKKPEVSHFCVKSTDVPNRVTIEVYLKNGQVLEENDPTINPLPAGSGMRGDFLLKLLFGYPSLGYKEDITKAILNKAQLLAVQDVVDKKIGVSEYNLSPVTRSIAAYAGIGPKPGNKLAGRRKTRKVKKRKSSTSRGTRSRR
jgi:hypothetical protein